MSDGVRKLDTGNWNARYVGPDGKRYSRTFRVKRDAVTWRGQELRLIDLDDWTPPASRKPSTRARTARPSWSGLSGASRRAPPARVAR